MINPEMITDEVMKQFEELVEPFPQNAMFSLYRPLHKKTNQGPVHKLDVAELAIFPHKHFCKLFLVINGNKHEIMVMKNKSIAYIDAIRFEVIQDEKYYLQVGLFDPSYLILPFRGTTLFPKLRNNKLPVGTFDLKSRVNGKTVEPLHASKFIDWGLKYILEKHTIKYLIATWEPGSINHEIYFDIRRKQKDSTNAIKKTWTYNQFSRNGFSAILASAVLPIDHNDSRNRGLAPEESNVVVLFGKD